jgi:ribosomal protein L37AE/L43A
MEEYEMTHNGRKYVITRAQVTQAFNETHVEDWKDLPGPELYHLIVIQGQEKPVKAVFQKIFGTNDFITSDAERVLKKLEIDFKVITQNQIYLIPIGSEDAVEHMYNTLLNGVEKSKIEAYGVSAPESVYDDNKTSLWGLIPGTSNERQWNGFSDGDFVIFVPTNYNLIVTRITHKIKSHTLAQAIWNVDQNGQTWELIFFVKIVAILEKSKRSLLTDLGYSTKDNLMGNRRITEKFVKRYVSIDNFINTNAENRMSTEMFEQEIAEGMINSSFNSRTNHKKRLETLEKAIKSAGATPGGYVEVNGRRIRRNQVLVAYVKERDGYKCKVCGFTFTKRDGTKYVEVAHIKGLAEGGPDDQSNMVALCANCHKKLDKGNEEAKNEILRGLGLIN